MTFEATPPSTSGSPRSPRHRLLRRRTPPACTARRTSQPSRTTPHSLRIARDRASIHAAPRAEGHRPALDRSKAIRCASEDQPTSRNQPTPAPSSTSRTPDRLLARPPTARSTRSRRSEPPPACRRRPRASRRSHPATRAAVPWPRAPARDSRCDRASRRPRPPRSPRQATQAVAVGLPETRGLPCVSTSSCLPLPPRGPRSPSPPNAEARRDAESRLRRPPPTPAARHPR